MNLHSFASVLIALFYFMAVVAGNADTPLESAMKQMSSVYKELSFDLQQPHDENKVHYLTLAGIFKNQVQVSRGLVPKKVATIPPDQRAAMVKAYQKSIDGLILSIDLLAQDIQNSKWDDARKVMAAIKQQMIYGHRDFRINN